VVKLSIFIDTEIWVFAQKRPDPSKFPNKAEFEKWERYHKLTKEFLIQKSDEYEISMTSHQFCEIFHALAFRGMKLPIDFVNEFCLQIIRNKFVRWYQINQEHVKKAMKLSTQSGIHIWDYICVLPLYKDVKTLYTCDSHFKDASFQSLGTPIENPIGEWFGL